MHIEPGVVQGAKMALSYATAVAAFGIAAKSAFTSVKENGPIPLVVKSFLTTALVFIFFQVFPHFPVGISEVHFILGSTLFLMFGVAPAAIGLAGGLLIQGLLFAPTDLPMYFVNITTLLMPLFAMSLLAKRIIPENVAYQDIKYSQALKLSAAYQVGVISWVGFWAIYGQGVGAENLAQVSSFGAAYLSVILVEPLADLAVLACVKMVCSLKDNPFVEYRLCNAAV
ncbi:Predicted cobalt transporter CbtC [hydrothermal vent metagenome]|uniref:Predicted cobalt transporter CbtC n=1 Tax=hydrothermal vent metagenome TaxID=652676 RepID=A0A3B1CY16_9ZZZZ